MSVTNVEEFFCPRCGGKVEAADRFCRHCAAPLGGHRPERPTIERRWFVLVMLFAAVGPLALPMLWRSREFSPNWKIVLTAAVVLMTVVLILLLWFVAWWMIHQLQPLRDLKGL